MSGWEPELSDDFLDDVEDAGPLVEGLTPGAVPPPPDLRARLLAAAQPRGRFARHAETAARLLDLDRPAAAELLDRIDDPSAWYQSALPMMQLIDLEGGPAVARAITGFVRIPGGEAFPQHEHAGEEHVFVIQGSLEDGVTGEVFRPGDVATMPAGSAHHFLARPGPDLVYLLVVQEGVTIAGQFFAYDDPRV